MECIRSDPVISAHSSKDFKIALKKMMQGDKKKPKLGIDIVSAQP